MKAKYLSLGLSDVPCPRCGQLAQAREHKAITQKQLNQPFYFTKWFNCINQQCKTTIFMSDQYKVFNTNMKGEVWKTADETMKEYDDFKGELNDKLKALGL